MSASKKDLSNWSLVFDMMEYRQRIQDTGLQRREQWGEKGSFSSLDHNYKGESGRENTPVV
jgi:hypothetical protein